MILPLLLLLLVLLLLLCCCWNIIVVVDRTCDCLVVSELNRRILFNLQDGTFVWNNYPFLPTHRLCALAVVESAHVTVSTS
eukprot:m.192292 g.192292  ORF g.192292 m.192292 type:complete len:81 (+) comp32458_c10_seq3:274-516(+)